MLTFYNTDGAMPMRVYRCLLVVLNVPNILEILICLNDELISLIVYHSPFCKSGSHVNIIQRFLNK